MYEKWLYRVKLTCRPSKQKIEKWARKAQLDYELPILIDRHPIQGWVAYLDPGKEN